MSKSIPALKERILQALVGVIFCLSIVILPPQPASADDIPGMPMILYGIVYHSGSAIGSGYWVEARINSSTVASCQTDASGKYGYGSGPLQVTGTSGNTISFHINGVQATTTVAYTGGAKNLDLQVSGTIPTSYTPANNNVTISTTSLSSGVVDTAYSKTMTATGGSGTYTWSFTGTMPAGLSLSSAGVLSGTPTASGTSSITVTATDANSKTDSKTYSITINTASSSSGTVTISTSSLASGTAGTSYSYTLSATGGSGSYTWVSNDTLPGGLTLSSAGVLSGTPANAGNYTVTVTATDGNSVSGTKSLSFYVAAAAASNPSSSSSSTSTSSTSTSSSTGPSSSATSSTSLAAFSMSDMTASPISSKAGNQVNISVRVANTGKAQGIKTLQLKINGNVEAQQEVVLSPGESQVVKFTVNKNTPGTYKASIDPLSADFAITDAPASQKSNDDGIPVVGIIIGVVLLVVLLVVLVMFKKRQSDY